MKHTKLGEILEISVKDLLIKSASEWNECRGVIVVKQKALTCPFEILSLYLMCSPCSILKNDLTFQKLFLSLFTMIHMQIQWETYSFWSLPTKVYVACYSKTPAIYRLQKKKLAHSWFSQAALTVVMFASTCLEVSKLNIPPWTASSTAEVQPNNCPTDWGETPALLKLLVTLKGRGFPFLLFTVTQCRTTNCLAHELPLTFYSIKHKNNHYQQYCYNSFRYFHLKRE